MAKKTEETEADTGLVKSTGTGSQTETATTTNEEATLPKFLTLKNAEKYSGEMTARDFYKAVAVAGGYGDLNPSDTLGGEMPTLDIIGLQNAAADEKNSLRAVAQKHLKAVESVFGIK